ncbi:MAG: gamma-glutamyltransferase [bacterium]|nr:MAG: gamma-glutamyltransferase [bacterium]
MKIKRFNLLISCLLLASFLFTIPLFGHQATGKSGMIVTAHPVASELGVEILKAGGNAIDAAVGAALVLGVVEPYGSGLGGGGAMLIYLREPDSLTFINYYQSAPENVPVDFHSSKETSSARAVLVPGTAAGLHHALNRYGSISWETILNKVIQKVEHGFEIDENFHKTILDSYEKIFLNSKTRSLYLINDFPPEIGNRIKNDQLIHTLKKLADEGVDVFYHGEIADSIQASMIKYGGNLRKSDLEAYQVHETNPLKGKYRQFEIFSAPPPQSGMTIIEALNILEFKNLKRMGDYTLNSKTFHFMAEALRRVYADRAKYLGDPKFEDVPVERVISKELARSRFKTINEYKTRPFGPGDNKIDVDSLLRRNYKRNLKTPDGSTSHISVVDVRGNAVSLTQTLNHFWGSGISVCGFLLNNGMTSFSSDADETPNMALPGKQPRTTIAPTMLFENGNLVMVVGTPGAGRIISTMVQVICNVVDFGMKVEAANLAPRFHSRRWNEKMPVEGRFSKELLARLETMGHSFQVMGEIDLFFGGVQLILVDQEKHELIGSSDPRRSGAASGY